MADGSAAVLMGGNFRLDESADLPVVPVEVSANRDCSSYTRDRLEHSILNLCSHSDRLG